MRYPSDILGKSAFVSRRPLHTLRLPLTPPQAAGKLVALRDVFEIEVKSKIFANNL